MVCVLVCLFVCLCVDLLPCLFVCLSVCLLVYLPPYSALRLHSGPFCDNSREAQRARPGLCNDARLHISWLFAAFAFLF